MILYFLRSKFLKQHLVGNLTRHKGPLPEWACSSLPPELLKPVDPWFSTVPVGCSAMISPSYPFISIHIPSYEAFQSHGVMGVPLVLIHFLFGFSWIFYETIQRERGTLCDGFPSAHHGVHHPHQAIHGALLLDWYNGIFMGSHVTVIILFMVNQSWFITSIYVIICPYVISSHYDL